MALAVPASILPHCHNTILVKLPIYAGTSALLLAVSSSVGKLRLSPVEICLVLLLPLFTLIDGSTALNPGVTRVILVSSACAVYAAVRLLDLDDRQVVLPLLAGGLLALVASLVLYSDQQRLAGLFGNANLLGSFTAALLPVGACYVAGRKSRWRLLAVPFVLFMVYMLLRSGTRSSLLALVLGVAAALFIRWKHRLLYVLTLLFIAAVILSALAPSFLSASNEATLQARSIIWRGAGRMFTSSPVLGMGTGSFQRDFPSYRDPDFRSFGVSANTVHAHSEPLEMLAENGLAGFLLFGGVVFLLLQKGTRKPVSLLQWGIIASVLVIMIESLASVALRWTATVFVLSVLMPLLPRGTRPVLKMNRFLSAGLILFSCLLAFAGYRALRMTQASCALGRAMIGIASGSPPEEILRYCSESLERNRNQAGAWYVTGNVWGMVASDRTGTDRFESLARQIAAYDSLEKRNPDFAWMRANRAGALLSAGNYNRAMDDIIHVYRTRSDERDRMVLMSRSVLPVVNVNKLLILKNLEISDALSLDLSRPASSKHEVINDALMALYSAAGVCCDEDTLDMILHDTDSVLQLSGSDQGRQLMETLEAELTVSVQGASLMMEGSLPDTGNLHDRLEELSSDGLLAAWHRAAYLRYGEVPSSEYQEYWRFVRTLYDPDFGLYCIYPALNENLIKLLDLSAEVEDGGHVDRMIDLLLFFSMMDLQGYRSYSHTGTAPEYWVDLCGPLCRASGFTNASSFYSYIRISEGSDDVRFRVVLLLTAGGFQNLIAADQQLLLDQTLREMDSLIDQATSETGEAQAFESISLSAMRVSEYFSTIAPGVTEFSDSVLRQSF